MMLKKPSKRSFLKSISLVLFFCAFNANAMLTYQFVDTYDEVCGVEDEDDGCAEISAFDSTTQKVFTTNGSGNALRVLTLLDNGKFVDGGFIDLSTYGAAPNSVAAYEGVLAVAMEAEDKQATGSVVIMDASTYALLAVLEVGALPDMLAFTPDGRYLVVANEGEPSNDYTVDPEGSISVIDTQTREVRHADFSAFNQGIDPNVRIFGPNATVAQDLEPEYIAISADSTMAYVSLQENNALAVVDILAASILDVLPLGFKDHSISGNGFDASNRDGGESCLIPLDDPEQCINIQTHPTLGMYQPDAIASYSINGSGYIVSANEGDARDYDGFSEEFRVGDDEIVLDETAYPTADSLKDNANLGRLKTTNATGDTDSDGDIDQIYSYGARSFSIWNSEGSLVFDSGDDFEQRLKDMQLAGIDVWTDSRSDDKGPEPESLIVAMIGNRYIAFIGLERVSGVFVYDITAPSDVKYVGYINTKESGDISPEGLIYIPRTSQSGILIVTNEVSNTTTSYRVTIKSMMSDAPVVANGGIRIESDDYYQVQTTDTYQSICEGFGVGFCATGSGIFNVINHSTGERFEAIEVSEEDGMSPPMVEGNVIRWTGEAYYQVQSVVDFQSVCEGFGISSCEVSPGKYHLINHTTGQRYEFIEVGM